MQKYVLRLLLLSVCVLGPAASADERACWEQHRVIEIDASSGPKFGTFQYSRTVELRPKEVVLTFDDGPDPLTTPKILDALDEHCFKATFFAIGMAAVKEPELAKEIVRRGHTLASHSWSHPRSLSRLPNRDGEIEIERGFSAVAWASNGIVAPFFRYPGLSDSTKLNQYLGQRGFATMSSDVNTDDWKKDIESETVIKRTLQRLEQKGGGIILMHDDRAVTAEALPRLLRELKSRGYKVVHMMPKANVEVASLHDFDPASFVDDRPTQLAAAETAMVLPRRKPVLPAPTEIALTPQVHLAAARSVETEPEQEELPEAQAQGKEETKQKADAAKQKRRVRSDVAAAAKRPRSASNRVTTKVAADGGIAAARTRSEPQAARFGLLR